MLVGCLENTDSTACQLYSYYEQKPIPHAFKKPKVANSAKNEPSTHNQPWTPSSGGKTGPVEEASLPAAGGGGGTVVSVILKLLCGRSG